MTVSQARAFIWRRKWLLLFIWFLKRLISLIISKICHVASLSVEVVRIILSSSSTTLQICLITRRNSILWDRLSRVVWLLITQTCILRNGWRFPWFLGFALCLRIAIVLSDLIRWEHSSIFFFCRHVNSLQFRSLKRSYLYGHLCLIIYARRTVLATLLRCLLQWVLFHWS